MNLALWTNLVAASVYAGVALLMIPGGQEGRAARIVAPALALTAIWTAVLALDAAAGPVPARVFVVLDALRYAAWCVALRSLAGMSHAGWLERGVLAACAITLLLAMVLPSPHVERLADHATLALSILGLLLVVQCVRHARLARRDAVNAGGAGIGGLFAADFFACTFLLSAGYVPEVSAARGLSVALLLPLVVLGVRRAVPTGSVLFISRHIVLYAVVVVGIAAYLALTALASVYLHAHTGGWAEVAVVLFLAVAAAVLVTLLLSKNAWRRLKVFIATHFYSGKYDYRVEWLRFIQTLSTGKAGDAPQTSIVAVAQMFHSPGGVLFMREDDADQYLPVAAWPNTALREHAPASIAPSDELPKFLAERQWVIDVEEYVATPDVYGDVQLPEWLRDASMWRVVTPLLHLERLVGFIVLQPPPPPFHMTFEDRDLFKTVGRHIALLLAQHSADRRLTESRQFDAYSRFTAFVMHDLKNAVAQLQLLVQNAARHRNNPLFFDDAISTISNSVDRMTRLIGQLQAREVHGQAREVALAALGGAAVSRARARAPAPDFEHASGPANVRADAEKLGSVLDHVIRNAQEATGERGAVRVSLTHDQGFARLIVRDDGSGMDAEFVRERLFRPFDSTKGSRGMGIGAYQVREHVRQLGGFVEVQSSPGRGTSFCINLPLCQTRNPDSPDC